MEMQRALSLARSLLAEHGLRDWTVVADRAKTRAGVCRFGRRQIGLSRPLTELHSEAEVRETILHEIAHALVGPAHGHDATWRAKAISIGSSGQRCLTPDAPRPVGDWLGRCPAGHERSRHRAPQRVQSCARCSRTFDLRFLFTWSYKGRPATMPSAYAAELALLGRSSAAGPPVPPARGSARAESMPLRLGDLVQVGVASRFDGETGVLEFVGSVRSQVRFDNGELVSVPTELLRLVPGRAARASGFDADSGPSWFTRSTRRRGPRGAH